MSHKAQIANYTILSNKMNNFIIVFSLRYIGWSIFLIFLPSKSTRQHEQKVIIQLNAEWHKPEQA